MSKLLSVIVPTYNMEKYLDRCLSSLIVSDTEMLDKLEVLIINDGSRDRSSEIAHSYSAKYPEVFFVTDKENGNYGSCVNTGLKIASAKYVKVLDADDYYTTEAFGKYLEKLSSADVDLFLNDKHTVDPDYRITGTETIPLKEGVTYSFSEIRDCWEAIDMHKMAYRRTLLADMEYHQTEGISYSDAEWMIKPFARIQTAAYSGENVYCYLQGREGQTIDKNVRRKSFRSLKTLLLSISDYWKNFSGEDIRKDFLKRYLIYSVVNIYREFFFSSSFDRKEFRDFDAKMALQYPEIMKEVDTHPWVSFIHNLKLSEDWRENRRIKYCLEMSLIRTYLTLRSSAKG